MSCLITLAGVNPSDKGDKKTVAITIHRRKDGKLKVYDPENALGLRPSFLKRCARLVWKLISFFI